MMLEGSVILFWLQDACLLDAERVIWYFRARLVPKNFQLEICAFSFGHVYGVLNIVKQQN